MSELEELGYLALPADEARRAYRRDQERAVEETIAGMSARVDILVADRERLQHRVQALRAALCVIRDHAGETDEETGARANAGWCAEQARQAIHADDAVATGDAR